MLSANTIYVQVYASRFVVKHIETGESVEVQRDQSFASPRMLVADFTMAQHQLKPAIKSVRRGLRAPQVLMHPMELIEGGLTQIEHRVFVELGLGSGASKVGVHLGPVLAGDAVQAAISAYKH